MLSNCIKVTNKNNLMNKYYSILIYNIQKQNKNTSDHFLVALIATGTSTLKVVRILVALKATVDGNVNYHC